MSSTLRVVSLAHCCSNSSCALTRIIEPIQYLLTPDEDGYESRATLLNGERMSINGGRLPEPRGIERGRDERVLLMPPISIAFVVVHGAKVKVCG